MSTKYSMECRVNGKTVSTYSHTGKMFIEGKEGSEYTLKVSNNTGRRVMAIVSVDGINVIDGKAAAVDTMGYIINAYSSIDIKGFRESDTHVGAFKFAAKEQSYAKESANGSETNCGIIGCLIVDEKETASEKANRLLQEQIKLLTEQAQKNKEKEVIHHYWPVTIPPYHPMPYWYQTQYTCSNTGHEGTPCNDTVYRSATTSKSLPTHFTEGEGKIKSMNFAPDVETDKPIINYSLCSQEITPTSFDLGSTWGQKLTDKVYYVEFERGAILETLSIYYASRESLEFMGVPVVKKKEISLPQAFPGFCVPPKSYQMKTN